MEELVKCIEQAADYLNIKINWNDVKFEHNCGTVYIVDAEDSDECHVSFTLTKCLD